MSKSSSLFLSGLLVGVLTATVGFAYLRRYQQSRPTTAGARAQTTLKLGHTQDVGHPVHHAIDRMRQRLEELSSGTMTIDIYPGSVLGSETQCIEQLQNGSLSMTKTSAAQMESFIPEMAVFGFPYVFRDEDHFWHVLDGPLGAELLQKGTPKYLRGLCYYDAGCRSFYTKERPVRTPADLEGQKIRVMNSATAIAMVDAIGASPTPIAWGELYSSLAQGIVDGAENNLPSFTTNKHYEVCKHFSLNKHTRIPDVLLISTKVWEKLSSMQQGWLAQAAQESAVYQRQLWAQETQRSREKAEAEGVTVYEVDCGAFAQSVQPMLDQVEDATVKAMLAAIQEVR